MPRLALFNPPAREPIVRRYMCSYHAGANRYPCLELLGLAGMARAQGHDVLYVDGVAEEPDLGSCLDRLRQFRPDILLSLAGLESFRDDLATLVTSAAELDGTQVGVMGHFPTLYPERTLAAGVDFVLRGEGETGLSALLAGNPVSAGLATHSGIGSVAPRLSAAEYRGLPEPAHDLLDPESYREVGLGSGLATTQFTRGCPYPCPHCIRSYGREMVARSPAQVAREFSSLAALGFRHVRILDDTFTANEGWVRSVCESIQALDLNVPWSSLSRVDTVTPGLVKAMASAGCRRIYLGIESGSPRVLKYYKKTHTPEDVVRAVEFIHSEHMEAVGFFVLGAPSETWADVEASVHLARGAGLDFVILNTLALYPGTPLERDLGQVPLVDPWSSDSRMVDPHRLKQLQDWEREFYRRFYLTPTGLKTGLAALGRDPRGVVESGFNVLRFVLGGRSEDERANLV